MLEGFDSEIWSQTPSEWCKYSIHFFETIYGDLRDAMIKFIDSILPSEYYLEDLIIMKKDSDIIFKGEKGFVLYLDGENSSKYEIFDKIESVESKIKNYAFLGSLTSSIDKKYIID